MRQPFCHTCSGPGICFCPGSGIEQGTDLQKFGCTHGTADLQTFDGSCQVDGTGKGQTALLVDSSKRITGLTKHLVDDKQVIGRYKAPAKFFAGHGTGHMYKPVDQLVKFKNSKCFFVHKDPLQIMMALRPEEQKTDRSTVFTHG